MRRRSIGTCTGRQRASSQPTIPSAPPPANLATTTTDHGITVPYIVRIERGTLNRGIHEIAVLFDPNAPWTPWAGQPQWNRKLVIQYGAGTSQQYRQGTPESVLSNEALSAGFAVANSSMLVNGQHSNFVTAAETTMMLKEHFIESYGEIRYTIGEGSSGGALLQHLIGDAYPGLLDGLRPTQRLGGFDRRCLSRVRRQRRSPAGAQRFFAHLFGERAHRHRWMGPGQCKRLQHRERQAGRLQPSRRRHKLRGCR